MTMQDLSIDFGEQETELWEDEPDGADLKSIFSRSSSAIITSSFVSIMNGRPFFDYSSFLAYMSTYDIKLVPENDLNKVAKLGSGATMTVFKGTCPSRWGNTEVAFKRLNLELPRTKSALPQNWEEQHHSIAAAALEIRVLSDGLLRFHPNIVDLLAVSWEELGEEDETQPGSFRSIRPVLIVELACPQYPTLDEYYKYSARNDIPVDFDTKISILSAVTDALSAVHICGVIHGDIKPQNVLIFQKGPNEPLVAKLSDFGGCQPAMNDEASMREFSVLGTEYWNAPEVIDAKGEPTLLSRKPSRDYYPMGLLIYYVLFGEMLFGDDEDDSHANLERIAKTKNDQVEMQQLIKRKMASHWIVVGEGEVLREIMGEPMFPNRLEIFRRLYAEKKVGELFLQRDPPQVTSGEERRQYPLYLTMRLFLHHDPEIRQCGDLMTEFRTFVKDSYTTRVLRDVYLMGGWENIQSRIENGYINVWDVRDLEGGVPGISSIIQPKITWKSPQHKISSDLSNSFSYSHINEIPVSLRKAVIQELKIRAGNTKDPQCIQSLLSLEYCRSLGYLEDDSWPSQYALEAAKLGSVVGKMIVFSTSKMSNLHPPIEPQVQCEWLLDYILFKMPSKNKFSQGIFDAFPRPAFLATILHMEFDVLVRQYKEIKIFEVDGEDSEVKQLFSAVVSGKVNQVKALLAGDGAENLGVKLDGFNLLHATSESDNYELVRVLIRDFGININGLNDKGVSPIALAARAHKPRTASVLLNLGADFRRLLCARTLRQVANYGGLPALYQLHRLAEVWLSSTPEDSFSMTSFLDGNFTAYPDDELDDDEPEFPPIFAAILGDSICTFWCLLELGCSRDNYAEFTSGSLAPIHVAANLRPLFLAILLHYGALPDIRTRDRHQSTALQLTCVAHAVPRYHYPKVTITDTFELDMGFGPQPSDYLDIKLFMIQLLVGEYGADVNAQDWFGRTAISLCISDRNNPDADSLEVARHLVGKCGANIHIKNFHGDSCLHLALAASAGLEHIEFCVQHGLNVNEKDIEGLTPLMVAAVSSTIEICQYLINNGADFLATTDAGWTCLDFAISRHRSDIVEYFFGVAEKKQLIPTLVSMADLHYQTLIHRIVRDGRESAPEYLARIAKADTPIDPKKLDIVGYTLLHHAVLAGNLIATEFLLQAGANVNAKGWRDLTPLHIAYAKEDPSIIKVLKNVENTNLACVDAAERTPEALGKLCAEDPGFWPNYLKLCNRESDEEGGKIDVKAIEDENRRKSAPKNGWFVV